MQSRVLEISPAALAAAVADGAFVIDVREPHEYESGHVPPARSIPVSTVTNRSASLPKREPLYVVCASGNRSRAVAEQLAAQGMDARTVAGEPRHGSPPDTRSSGDHGPPVPDRGRSPGAATVGCRTAIR